MYYNNLFIVKLLPFEMQGNKTNSAVELHLFGNSIYLSASSTTYMHLYQLRLLQTITIDWRGLQIVRDRGNFCPVLIDSLYPARK